MEDAGLRAYPAGGYGKTKTPAWFNPAYQGKKFLPKK
jgi:hypothetical protein